MKASLYVSMKKIETIRSLKVEIFVLHLYKNEGGYIRFPPSISMGGIAPYQLCFQYFRADFHRMKATNSTCLFINFAEPCRSPA